MSLYWKWCFQYAASWLHWQAMNQLENSNFSLPVILIFDPPRSAVWAAESCVSGLCSYLQSARRTCTSSWSVWVRKHGWYCPASGDHGFILVCNSAVWRCGVGPLHRLEVRNLNRGHDSANCTSAPINTTRAKAGFPNQRDTNKSHWLSINDCV